MKTPKERRMEKVEEPFNGSGVATAATDDYNDEETNRVKMVKRMRRRGRKRMKGMIMV